MNAGRWGGTRWRGSSRERTSPQFDGGRGSGVKVRRGWERDVVVIGDGSRLNATGDVQIGSRGGDTMMQDVRYALRLLGHNRGFGAS